MGPGDVLLTLIGDTHGLTGIAAFRRDLLGALQRALPVDWISLNDIGSDPAETVVLADPSPPPELFAPFTRWAHQNPLLVFYRRTGNGRAMRFSDLVTPDELHALELYRTVYAPLGVEHQLAFTLPHSRDRVLAVALSRGAADFTDAERDMVEAARPFLIQAYRNAINYSEALATAARGATSPAAPTQEGLEGLGLTRRQAEILRLLATGAAEREIARRLQISLRTVEKHLQDCYRRLQVSDRAAAAGRAWATVNVPDAASGPTLA